MTRTPHPCEADDLRHATDLLFEAVGYLAAAGVSREMFIAAEELTNDVSLLLEKLTGEDRVTDLLHAEGACEIRGAS